MPAQPCYWLCNITWNRELYLNSSWSACCTGAALSPTLWANRKENCVPALLRSPKGRSHYVPAAIPWVRLSVTLYQGWIQWQLPNVIGSMHLLHAKRTKCPAMLYWYGCWRHGAQLGLRLIWARLENAILHDKRIPWILPSIHWEENLLSILGHDYGLCHEAV